MVKKPSYEELEQRVKELEVALGDSELERTTILDLQPYHSVIQSLDNSIIWANRAAFESVGVSREDLIGRYCYEIWPQRTNPCPDCPVIKSVQTGKPQSTEKTTPDGRKWHIRGYPIRNNRGHITRALEVTEEITGRKQAEEALRKSEKKYRSLLETTSQGYVMVNSEFKAIEVNQALGDMLGYTLDEMLGKTPFEFVEYENRKILIEQASRISITPHRRYEVTLKKKNGQELNAYVNATTIRDKSGEVQGAFALITDITDIKYTEQKLKQREKELEIKNIRLEEMNTALKILLEKRDEDKKELEEKIMTNIKELVLPYVTKLKNTKLDDRQEVFADIIQSNIEEILSPFAQKLSHKYLNFTPTELKVAYLVKQGLRTKEIAKLLGSSPETITRHRKSMRKKLKLTDKKSNLRTHLLSLSNGHIK